jgi:hypothetical protein
MYVSRPYGLPPVYGLHGFGICDPHPFGINDPMPHEGVDASGVVVIPQC